MQDGCLSGALAMFWLLVAISMSFTSSVEGGRLKSLKKGRSYNDMGTEMAKQLNSEHCTHWEKEPCVHFNYVCGAGYQMGHREGELCTLKHTYFYCWSSCEHLGDRTLYIPQVPDRIDIISERSLVKVDGSEKLHGNVSFNEAVSVSCREDGERYALPDGCSYRAGAWDPCEKMLLRWSRNDTFVSKSKPDVSCHSSVHIVQECKTEQVDMPHPRCDTTVPKVTRNQVEVVELPLTELPKKMKCRYDYRAWSRCVQDTGRQVKVRHQFRTLIAKVSDPECEKTRTLKKKCYKNSGKERCFLTAWSEYSGCDEAGFEYKTRRVQYGHGDCSSRKLIKSRRCKKTKKAVA